MRCSFQKANRCPACGNDRVKTVSFAEGTIHVCGKCSLQWADRVASAIEGDVDVTGCHQRYMDPASIDPLRYPPYLEFFATLAGHFGDRSLDILDIGCGNGVFLAEAVRRGHRVIGIELDVRHRPNLPVVVADRVIFASAEDALPGLEQRFDVVTFWDSFEHIDDPFALVEVIRPKLGDDGIVFVRVNNTRDVINWLALAALRVSPRGLGRKLVKICFNLPQHAWNFSMAGMSAMLAANGWRIISCRATETPTSRLSANPAIRALIAVAYLCNRLINGGKIGEYWFSSKPASAARSSGV